MNLDKPLTVEAIGTSTYLRTLRDLLVGYVLLAPLLALVFTNAYQGFPVGLKVAVLIAGCVLHGLVFHYISLFTHAAGHRELAPRQELNDTIGNVLAGYLFLTSIPMYRRKHFGHHRHIGTDKDPEGTYALAPNMRNLLGVFFYVIPMKKALQIFRYAPASSGGKAPSSSFEAIGVVAVFACMQLLVLYIFASAGLLLEWVFLWAIPLYNLMPVITWLRTLSEHRPLVPDGEFDATYRAFDRGALAFFMGAAGFRDHDLHHYYPGVHHQLFPSLQLPPDDAAKRSKSGYLSVIHQVFRGR